ncbi:hypothetical protein HWI79_3001 [Cryptosporidium felis]|nr:hypothetical protein HWI79_3001 [Cryptosporidium felis]
MRISIIKFLLVALIQSVYGGCSRRTNVNSNIAILNDFSISIRDRIKIARSEQNLAAKKYAEAKISVNLEYLFCKLSLSENEVLSRLLNNFGKYKRNCIKLGILAFCCDLAQHLLSTINPSPELLMTEAIKNIYRDGRDLRTESTTNLISTPDNSKLRPEAMTRNNSSRTSENSNMESRTIQINLRLNKKGYPNINETSELPETAKHNFRKSEILPFEDLNEQTVLLVSSVIKRLINASLKKQNYELYNVPSNIYQLTMKRVFNEFGDSLNTIINQDVYFSPSALNLKCINSYYFFACRLIEAESTNGFEVNNPLTSLD